MYEWRTKLPTTRNGHGQSGWPPVVNVFAQIWTSHVQSPLLECSANFVGYSYIYNLYIYTRYYKLYQIISRSELMLVWLYHISMILTEIIPICSPQLQPGVAWQVPIRGRITLVADHVTEFYGCSGRALRSPLANVPANCRATFLCFVALCWLSLSLLTMLTVQEFPKLWRLGTTCEKRKNQWHCSRGFSRRVHFQLIS